MRDGESTEQYLFLICFIFILHLIENKLILLQYIICEFSLTIIAWKLIRWGINKYNKIEI